MTFSMMKAKDLKADIDWTVSADEGRYAKIARYLSDAWVAEPKLDGVRSKIVIGSQASTVSTWRRDVTGNFPQFASVGIRELDGTVLDGEIIAATAQLQTSGTWTDSLLNASVALTNSSAVKAVAAQKAFGDAQFWAFDVLSVAGSDVTGWAMDKRRKALETVIAVVQDRHPGSGIQIVPQYSDPTPEIIEQFLASGFEGAMLKKRTATYHSGKRSDAWMKVKRYSTADGFIVGFKPGQNGRSGKVGSVEVAVMGTDGSPLPVASLGNLDVGLQEAMTALDGTLKDEWYGVCVEWMAQGLGKNGRARHPHLVRVRPDKRAQDCGIDQLGAFARV